MTRPATRVVQAAVLVVALCAGYLAGTQQPDPANPLPGPPDTALAMNEPSPADPGISHEADAMTETNKSEHTTRSPTLETLETIALLNDRLRAKFGVTMLGGGEQLSDDFVALFGLSTAEADALRAELAAAGERLAELEASHATIEPANDGIVTITVAPFPIEGGAVHDRLLATIRSVLGEDRYAYYSRLNPSEFENSTAFGQFGLGESVITVSDYRDEHGRPYAMSRMNNDSGVWNRTSHLHPQVLGKTHPQLYEKLIATGAFAEVSLTEVASD